MFNLFVLPWDQPLYKKLVLWLLVGLGGIQHLSIYLFILPFVYLFLFFLSIFYLSNDLPTYPYVYQKEKICEASFKSGRWQVQTEAILRDVLKN